jgi:hypothetical protein
VSRINRIQSVKHQPTLNSGSTIGDGGSSVCIATTRATYVGMVVNPKLIALDALWGCWSEPQRAGVAHIRDATPLRSIAYPLGPRSTDRGISKPRERVRERRLQSECLV